MGAAVATLLLIIKTWQEIKGKEQKTCAGILDPYRSYSENGHLGLDFFASTFNTHRCRYTNQEKIYEPFMKTYFFTR